MYCYRLFDHPLTITTKVHTTATSILKKCSWYGQVWSLIRFVLYNDSWFSNYNQYRLTDVGTVGPRLSGP